MRKAIEPTAFPLPLTPFEHYMFTDDNADWPMLCTMRMRYEGSINRVMFQQAVCDSLHLHPLLGAIVVGGDRNSSTRQLSWDSSTQTPQVVFVDGDASTYVSPPFDIRQSPGLRIIVGCGTPDCCILVLWHHAVCDGQGICSFVDSLLDRYEKLIHGTIEAFEVERAQEIRDSWIQLRSRGDNAQSFVSKLVQQPHQINRIIRFFVNPIVALRSNAPPTNCTSHEHSCFETVTEKRELTLAVMQNARDHGVSVNDWLLASFYRAIVLVFFDGESTTKRLRIAIPVSLRSGASTNESSALLFGTAVNRVSMIFMDRAVDAIKADASKLLHSIQAEMQGVKKWNLGWALIYSLALAGKFPTGMHRLVQSGGETITAVFSNLVQPFGKSRMLNSAGALQTSHFRITSMEPFAPLHKGVVMGVDVLTYANQLVFTMHYDSSVVRQDQAQHMLRALIAFAGER